MELQDQNSIIDNKCQKYQTYCEKLKEEREQYKEAWQSTQKNFDQARTKWENEKNNLQDTIDSLGEQLAGAEQNRGDTSINYMRMSMTE